MTSIHFALLHYLHHVLSGLIWVQTVCKGYQQKSQLAGKELNSALSDGVKNKTKWLHHAKTCLQAFAANEGPDQPTHLCSLIRTFTVC